MFQICGKDILIEGKLVRIARLNAEGYDTLVDPQSALKEIRQCGRRVDLFTFVEKLADPSRKFDYHTEPDNLAALPVSTFDHWMSKQIDFKARNKARKCGKAGVIVKEVGYDDDFVRGISAIYNESPVRQGKKFWHYGKSFDEVRRMNGTYLDRSIFLGAFLDGSLIGFIKMVTNEDRTQAGLMQIVSMIQHRDKAPTNALVAQAVKSCAERNIPYIWYANFSYGKKQEDGLAEFKRHNGFQKVEIPRYYVPLTWLGKMALRAGLHHGASDWIPEPMAATYRKARKIWYEKRFQGLESA